MSLSRALRRVRRDAWRGDPTIQILLSRLTLWRFEVRGQPTLPRLVVGKRACLIDCACLLPEVRGLRVAGDAAALRPLRWHHSFGSLLVAGGVDVVSIKDAMGHSQLTTTSRYLHARPATERAAAFTAAFGGSANTASYPRRGDSVEQPEEP